MGMPTSLRGTARLSPAAYRTLLALPYRDGAGSIVDYLHGGLAYDEAAQTLTIDVGPANLYFNRTLVKAIASVKADGASSWGRGHEASRFAAAQVAASLTSLPAL